MPLRHIPSLHDVGAGHANKRAGDTNVAGPFKLARRDCDIRRRTRRPTEWSVLLGSAAGEERRQVRHVRLRGIGRIGHTLATGGAAAARTALPLLAGRLTLAFALGGSLFGSGL